MAAPLSPAPRALVVHAVCGLAVAGGALLLIRGLAIPVALIPATLVEGLLAAMIGRMVGLAGWWIPINLAFAPCLALLATSDLPAWSYLMAFGLLLLVNWNSFGARVPLYLTGPATLESLVTLLPRDRPFLLIDLGCGLGGPLQALATRFPKSAFLGIESAPIPYLIAKARTLGCANARVAFGDIFAAEVGEADFIYAFLSPAPMERLWAKLSREMKPGAIFISNSFAVPNLEPVQTVEVGDLRATRLYVYRKPES